MPNVAKQLNTRNMVIGSFMPAIQLAGKPDFFLSSLGVLSEFKNDVLHHTYNMRVYPKVSGLATWSENCKWYSSLPLGAVVSLFYKSI
jgi:hypothetical protein